MEYYQAWIDKDIAKKVKFTSAPKSCTDGKSIILVNIEYLTFEELFGILTSLFYYIKETANNYNK